MGGTIAGDPRNSASNEVSERVFLDTSVLVRYLSEDDPPRALAAARLIEGDNTVVISGVVILEAMHALRTGRQRENPELARVLIRFGTRHNVELIDADKVHLVAALERSLATSVRRIPDAILAATAEHAGCSWIATFDEAFDSPTIPSRLI
jgi:predicted nucleic acid-binding protein